VERLLEDNKAYAVQITLNTTRQNWADVSAFPPFRLAEISSGGRAERRKGVMCCLAPPNKYQHTGAFQSTFYYKPKRTVIITVAPLVLCSFS